MNRAAAWRGGRRRLGPTEAEYQRAHPEVNWDTHEVHFRMEVGSRARGGPMVTWISGHARKFSMNSLYSVLDRDEGVRSGTNWRLDNSLDGRVPRHWEWTRWRAKEDDDDDW